MKAISLHQPWASLIQVDAKRIETRHWPTSYRGPIAIHAAKKWDGILRALAEGWPFCDFLPAAPDALPRGCVIATAELYDCVRMSEPFIHQVKKRAFDEHGRLVHPDIYFGHYEVGRYAWLLRNIRAIEPVPCRGTQGLFEADIKIPAAAT